MTVRRTTVPEETHDLGTLRLYREDLQAIASVVAESGTLKISGAGMDADSADDLDQFPGKLTALTIEAVKDDTTSPVIVKLTETAATVKLTDPSTQTRGILMGIRQICEARRLRLRSRASRFQNIFPLIAVIGIVEIAFIIVTAWGLVDPKKASAWVVSAAWLACLSAAVPATAVYITLALLPRVTLINMPRAESPTYWQRTRDNWIIGMITGLIGTAVGIGIGFLLQK